MKKFNFLILFFLLFSVSFTQDFTNKLKNTRMGLYVAPTLNFIQTDSEQTETNSKPGIVYGYAIEMSLNENHRLESGLAISNAYCLISFSKLDISENPVFLPKSFSLDKALA